MSKIDPNTLNETLEAFAEALGLEWHRYQQVLTGTIDNKLVGVNPEELIDIAKDTYPNRTEKQYYCGFGSYGTTVQDGDPVRVPTILGKVEALADHLGVEFEVQPEKVSAEKIKVKKVSKK